MKFYRLLPLLILVVSGQNLAQARVEQMKARAPRQLIPAETWIAQETQVSVQRLRENISPLGTVTGVVIASPQKENPNYFRHWVRDAALTMEVVLDISQHTTDPVDRHSWEKLLHDFTVFSRQNQLAQTAAKLGEPVFEVSGEPFRGPWGRPQNDGPALRAIALIRWAESLLDRGQEDYVRTWLYATDLPAQTVVKADLEYVSHHWKDPSFDLWEEVKGQHFFTQMVQRKALVLGARLARRLKDPAAAKWYQSQAKALEQNINTHWDDWRGYILATTHWVEGVNYKNSQLDIAVILGVIHGSTGSYFNVTDTRVVQTFERLVTEFAGLYPVNRIPTVPGVALGRYPEDLYAGTDFDGGNPWVLATLAAAQYCYESAAELSQKNPSYAKKMLARGDDFFQRVQFHSNKDGSLSEQIQRTSGYMVSARDLTWNYSAVLTAAWARQKSIQLLKH
jgi:glucoamylase